MGKIVPADIEGRNGSVPRASDVVARRDALCRFSRAIFLCGLAGGSAATADVVLSGLASCAGALGVVSSRMTLDAVPEVAVPAIEASSATPSPPRPSIVALGGVGFVPLGKVVLAARGSV